MELDDKWISGVNLIRDPTRFKETIKSNPKLIFTDPVIQSAIKTLTTLCRLGTVDQAERAKKLLNDAGIPAFIPKKAQKRRTDNITLRYLKELPDFFILTIETFKDEIKFHWKDSYKASRKPTRREKMEVLKIAFKNVFEGDLSDQEAMELTIGERSKDITAITLSCISYCYKIPFEALKSEYYAIKKKYSSSRISNLRKHYELGFQYYSELIQLLQSLF